MLLLMLLNTFLCVKSSTCMKKQKYERKESKPLFHKKSFCISSLPRSSFNLLRWTSTSKSCSLSLIFYSWFTFSLIGPTNSCGADPQRNSLVGRETKAVGIPSAGYSPGTHSSSRQPSIFCYNAERKMREEISISKLIRHLES